MISKRKSFFHYLMYNETRKDGSLYNVLYNTNILMKKFFSSDLKKRGWSNAMIHSLLPKPIEEQNPYIPAKTVKFWNADDVQKVENSDAFKNYKNFLENTCSLYYLLILLLLHLFLHYLNNCFLTHYKIPSNH